MGDEWMAMAQYNKKLYEKQIKEEKEKDAEIKRRRQQGGLCRSYRRDHMKKE